MASAFTHVLVGAAIASVGPRELPRRSQLRLAVVLGLLAVLPDADVVGFRFGIPYEHPLGHRGLTHSLAFAFACGLLTPALAGLGRPLGRAWIRVALLGTIATASHGFLDALTDGGLGVGFLVPFSAERWFLPWQPLRVSPLSVGAFFTPSGLRILASEVLWVWLPLFALLGVAALSRRRRAAPSGGAA